MVEGEKKQAAAIDETAKANTRAAKAATDRSKAVVDAYASEISIMVEAERENAGKGRREALRAARDREINSINRARELEIADGDKAEHARIMRESFAALAEAI